MDFTPSLPLFSFPGFCASGRVFRSYTLSYPSHEGFTLICHEIWGQFHLYSFASFLQSNQGASPTVARIGISKQSSILPLPGKFANDYLHPVSIKETHLLFARNMRGLLLCFPGKNIFPEIRGFLTVNQGILQLSTIKYPYMSRRKRAKNLLLEKRKRKTEISEKLVDCAN